MSQDARQGLASVERLNADLKQAIGKKVPVRTKAKLRDAIQQHMATLESNRNVYVASFRIKMVNMLLKTSKGRINSNSIGGTKQRAFVTITPGAVPLPVSAVLFAPALMALVGLSRKKLRLNQFKA